MKLLIASMALLMSAAALSAGSVVANGGFETGDFTGWSLSGNTSFTGVAPGYFAHSGEYGAFLGAVGSNSYLSQTVSTVEGVSYTLDYWLENQSGTPNAFAAYWNGQEIASMNNAGGFDYTEYTFSGLVGTGSDTLMFAVRQDPAYYGLDDVSLSSSIPEPATLGLIGVALIGLGVLRKKIRH